MKRPYQSNYKEFRREFATKQKIVLFVLYSFGAIYSLVAPFVISGLGLMEFHTLHREFRPLLAGSLISVVIESVIIWNKKLQQEKYRNAVARIMDYTTLFFCICLFGFADHAYYYSFLTGENVSPFVFMSCSLIVASMVYVAPMIFGVFYVLECAVLLGEMSYLNGGWHANSYMNYNLIIFMILVLFIVNIRYSLGLKSFRQQKEIERMQTESEKFMASVTHEMRTPLNAVLGKNELIRRETKEQETSRLTKEINSSGKMLLSLINDILDLSKLRAGKMNIVPADYSFDEMRHEIIGIMKSEAEGRGLDFQSEIDPSIPATLNGDEVRVKQVLLNLLSNAVKYTREGSVLLSVTQTQIENGIVSLHFSVKDTGVGIREEDLPALTKEFVRVDEKQNRKTQGTGLGLSITASLLRMMGSELKVKSEYGKGSEFYFDLNQAIVDDTPFTEKEKEKQEQEKLLLPNLKVLIVDDNRVNFTVAKGLMRLYQILPVYAPGGAECLNLLESNRYDVIFLDHMMPDMDGLETLQAIQRKFPSVPKNTSIIALTANSSSNADEFYRELGFDGYLAKPINPKQLEQVLRTCANQYSVT